MGRAVAIDWDTQSVSSAGGPQIARSQAIGKLHRNARRFVQARDGLGIRFAEVLKGEFTGLWI